MKILKWNLVGRKFGYFLLSLLSFNCLSVHKDTSRTELDKNNLNQSEIDIVYTIKGKKLDSWLTDEEYSSQFLRKLRDEGYFANPKVFSKNEYFFVDEMSKYKIVLEMDESYNSNSSWRIVWLTASIYTLGLIPYHGKANYHYTLKIYSKEKKLLKEFEYKNEADLYLHLFLLPFSDFQSVSQFKPEDEMFKRIAKEINLLP